MQIELILRLYGENVPLGSIATIANTTPKKVIEVVHFDITKDLGAIKLGITKNKSLYGLKRS